MKNIETEKATLEIPKAIMDFLRAHRENVQEYLECSIVHCFRADIDCSGDGPFGNKHVIEKFNLEPVFKAWNIGL